MAKKKSLRRRPAVSHAATRALSTLDGVSVSAAPPVRPTSEQIREARTSRQARTSRDARDARANVSTTLSESASSGGPASALSADARRAALESLADAIAANESKNENENENDPSLRGEPRMSTGRPPAGGEERYATELRARSDAAAASKAVSGAGAHARPESRPESRPEFRSDGHTIRDEDDVSIPPVDVDAERFFAEGERRESLPLFEIEHEDLQHPAHAEIVRRLSPEVQARRQRYVKIAQRVVGALALVALVGLGKAVVLHAPSADLPLGASIAQAAEPPRALAKSSPQEAPKADAPKAAAVRTADIPAPVQDAVQQEAVQEAAQDTQARAARAGDPAATSADLAVSPGAAGAPVAPSAPAATAVAPSVATPAAAASAIAAPASDPVDAKVEKRAAQKALDRGDNTGAIEAGEKAIAADPVDAETYLVVGAAYQASGQNSKAHQVFRDCAKSAHHGPVGECAALR